MKCVEVYKELYHQEPFDVAFCPYRISPLGAHIDHQYGKINGLAIDKGIHMAYHPKQNGVVELQSLNFPKRAQFFVNAVPEEKQGDWADHLRGAAKMLGEKYRLKVGLSGIIEGSLPIGGLSSSAYYYYESQGNEHQTIPHNHFEDMEWHIRLVLEGEDRLVRNIEARESETFSYAVDVNPEYNNEMEDPRINVMDIVLNKEFLRRASELLKKHQWEMICRHYIEGMTHREIAAEMGVSHQYVTKGIKKGLHRIRCTYT